MPRGGQIAIGSCILIDGDPCIALEKDLEGDDLIRVRARDLRSGGIVVREFRDLEDVAEAEVHLVRCQYQYCDGESFVFMNDASFEELGVPVAGQAFKAVFLKTGETYSIVLWRGAPIDILIPPRMVFTIVEFESYLRGDELFSATKPARTETGLIVRVPLFIEPGERIIVDTETRDFIELAT